MHGTPLPTDTDTDDVGEGLSLPELTTPRWWHFGDQASKATWGVIGRRLPSLIRQACAPAAPVTGTRSSRTRSGPCA
ncbi:hypothetical protein MRI28_07005 [Nocardiopsis dassonvillei]|uniref:hypothetical protein n=1 Tax=Nocardiopsis dassonvillei TaxID=2014 RepID=UPI0020109C85|nr:hypothetical protein [Nocardiopsis dassonvillei]MCK9869402.1 hypothetical protein [Nocardiopsis dassonvillei]